MPAGDLLTADWQLEINGLLTGATTIYQFGPSGISGIFSQPPKTQDVDLAGRDGVFANPDRKAAKTILVDYEIAEASAEDGFDAISTLSEAWAPSLTDVELHIQLPGIGHIYFVGRPRGFEDDAELARMGVFGGTAEFLATEPDYVPAGS